MSQQTSSHNQEEATEDIASQANQWMQKLHHTAPKLAQKVSLTLAGGAITAQSLAASIPLFACGAVKMGAIKFGLDKTRAAKAADKAIVDIADNWIGINNRLIDSLVVDKDWRISLPKGLGVDKKYLLICNHQSWVDTSIIQYVSEGVLPLTRFFAKHELIYIPVVGQAFYLLDFPMMKRHSREEIANNPELANRDLQEARRACQLLEDKSFVLLNYLEGTRFTKQKHQAQASPYRHLLKPKAGGLALSIASLGEQIDGILDMTLVYPDGVPTYQELWSGKLTRLAVDIREVQMDEALFEALKLGGYHQDEATKAKFYTWLDECWQAKDERIEALLAQFDA